MFGIANSTSLWKFSGKEQIPWLSWKFLGSQCYRGPCHCGVALARVHLFVWWMQNGRNSCQPSAQAIQLGCLVYMYCRLLVSTPTVTYALPVNLGPQVYYSYVLVLVFGIKVLVLLSKVLSNNSDGRMGRNNRSINVYTTFQSLLELISDDRWLLMNMWHLRQFLSSGTSGTSVPSIAQISSVQCYTLLLILVVLYCLRAVNADCSAVCVIHTQHTVYFDIKRLGVFLW